ncbi:uncharacterized protein LOC124776027 [Schistocerca piceifrons]|uniref:uncharacterized protein LOC124776027 n=1 Tax=Schistocerca piceifrons TaxID=274613 RepID=UPI001F5E98C2|nr:uncharacterized protein LOC124776027 [Schistocerca piceifrons]
MYILDSLQGNEEDGPDYWEPLYKKTGTADINNHRQLSILKGFTKVIERIMYQRLAGYLNKSEILTNAQNGFRKKRSTQALDRTELNCGIILGLSKAFDLISYDLLFMKADFYGIYRQAFKWFKSYISGRQ